MTQPEIVISTPVTSRSGMWELYTDGRSAGNYDDFWMMIDFLAVKYASDEVLGRAGGS